MVFDTFSVRFCGFLIQSKVAQKRDDYPVTVTACGGQFGAFVGQKGRAVFFACDEPITLQTGKGFDHRWLGNAHVAGNIDRTRLAIFLDQISDQLDIILDNFALAGLAHRLKSVRLAVGSAWPGRSFLPSFLACGWLFFIRIRHFIYFEAAAGYLQGVSLGIKD